jgi:hypothetical protein
MASKQGEGEMTYKDMTFCTAKDCRNLDCHRNMNRPDFQPGEQLVAMCNFKWKCTEFKKEQGK